MKIRLSENADIQYQELAPALKKAADKQFIFLADNLRHPSLKAKKYDEASDLWQARVSGSWRFYFFISADAYSIASIKKHPK